MLIDLNDLDLKNDLIDNANDIVLVITGANYADRKKWRAYTVPKDKVGGSGLPDATSASQGDSLILDANLEPVWAVSNSNSIGNKLYLASNFI